MLLEMQQLERVRIDEIGRINIIITIIMIRCDKSPVAEVWTSAIQVATEAEKEDEEPEAEEPEEKEEKREGQSLCVCVCVCVCACLCTSFIATNPKYCQDLNNCRFCPVPSRCHCWANCCDSALYPYIALYINIYKYKFIERERERERERD